MQSDWSGRERCPTHDVKIRVITGTSAGAIVGATLLSEFRQGRNRDPSQRSRLYETWVNQVDIRPLLDLNDLSNDTSKVTSVLDASYLDRIAEDAFNVQWTDSSLPPYLADPLSIAFCVTNLRGLPYTLKFNALTGGDYGMSHHADYMRFSLSASGQQQQGTEFIPLGRDNGMAGNWKVLKESTLASGAFPVGLCARVLERKAGDSNRRPWPVPQVPKCGEDKPPVCETEAYIDPAWPADWVKEGIDRKAYTFVNVDGGVANNEPVELARKILADSQGRLERDRDKNSKTVLMIDPFPSEAKIDPKYEAEQGRGLFNVLSSLISATISELRFKKEELVLAKDPNVFSRWAISPSRTSRGNNNVEIQEQYALATGGLSGFGGFLDRLPPINADCRVRRSALTGPLKV